MMKLALFVLSGVWSMQLLAVDWPMYRGVKQDGISVEAGWAVEFAGDGPAVRWEAEIGIGFSSFVTADGRVYTTGHTDGQDTVFCFDLEKGKLVWQHSYPADLGDKYYEGGTGATPTLAEGRLYHLSRWGDVFCFDTEQGKVIWNKNVQKETGLKIPDWGFSGAPLVLGDLLILNVGQAGLALNKATGATVWKSGNEVAAGYSTPYALTGAWAGLVVIGVEDRYVAVEGKTGAVKWEVPWKTRYGVNAADPIQAGDELFLSSGYNRGCGLFKLGASAPEVIWENKNLKNQFSSSVLLDGYLYGIDDDESKKASLRCVDWKTGKVMWMEPSIGFGALMAADGKLIVQTEKGELAIVKATADGYEEISRSQVLSGRCWTTPMLADGFLWVRNSMGQMKCLDLTKKK
jgi:outer membrane protein assembly factor BamB